MNVTESVLNDMNAKIKEGVDSKQEFNDRLGGADKLVFNLHQQALELENRILQADAKIAALDIRFAERVNYIEEVLSLYRENIQIFDREIEKAQKMKFKLVALSSMED